ncbi:MAG: hypothetical protein FJ312_02440 [SAR202 cluster bacterium]|nr:hypothetical protein [SAR202 cluster bacterium]
MGLDIGIISIRYLDRPDGWAYEFAKELALEARVNGYMAGEETTGGAFTQPQALRMLARFAGEKHLDDVDKADVLDWVEPLPWDGWDDDLPTDLADDEDEYDTPMDYHEATGVGVIELHFNW